MLKSNEDNAFVVAQQTPQAHRRLVQTRHRLVQQIVALHRRQAHHRRPQQTARRQLGILLVTFYIV